MLVALGILIAIVGWMFSEHFNNQNQPMPPASPTVSSAPSPASSTDGMKTYTNTEFGFEFQYPENWSFEINSFYSPFSKFNLQGNTSDKNYNPLNPAFMINIVTPDFAEGAAISMQNLGSAGSEIVIAAIKGMKYTYTFEGRVLIDIIIPLKSTAIIFETDQRHVDTFNQVVTSFKFLSGMKTYRNEKYGFKLEYPEKYIIKENEISWDSEVGVPEDRLKGYRYEKPVSPLFYLEFYSSSTIKNPEITIAVYNANKLNINKWIDYINKGVKQRLIYEGRYISNIESIFVLGIESVKALSGCCMECVMNIFIPKENKIYDLKQDGSISLPQECPNGFNERYGCCLQNEDVFNQILTTFKFLK